MQAHQMLSHQTIDEKSWKFCAGECARKVEASLADDREGHDGIEQDECDEPVPAGEPQDACGDARNDPHE